VLWFAVWTTLVVATLVGAFFLGRSLWRSVRALLAELHKASEVMERLETRLGELEEAAAAAAADAPGPDVGAGAERRAELREVLRRLRRERAERAEVRAERHAGTYERWRSFSR